MRISRELLKKKDADLILGIVFLICFWPVSIYFFIKVYKKIKD